MKPIATIKSGLLATAIVTISALSATSAQACACCETYSVHKVAYWDVLNVRSGPGVWFNKIGALKPKEGCIGLSGERKGKWVYVYANESGQKGWVHSRYLKYRHGG